MRMKGLALAALCCLFASSGSPQPRGSDAITADQHLIGTVQTRIQKYEQALGVVNQLARPNQATVECNAVCYFPRRCAISPAAAVRSRGAASRARNVICTARSIRRSAGAIDTFY